MMITRLIIRKMVWWCLICTTLLISKSSYTFAFAPCRSVSAGTNAFHPNQQTLNIRKVVTHSVPGPSLSVVSSNGGERNGIHQKTILKAFRNDDFEGRNNKSNYAQEGGVGRGTNVKVDPLIQLASLSLRRTSWLSWWGQVILTTISAVTLIFAKSVLTSTSNTYRRVAPGGFFLAGSGITLSILSIFWTWGGARLSRRLLRKNASRIKAATMIRRAITIGTSLNLLGMFVTLIGAEQIIGLLATKVLTQQGILTGGIGNPGAVATQTLQPLDILVVQANTNTMLSHFVGLVCGLYLTRNVRRLDPPSVEDDDEVAEDRGGGKLKGR